MLAPFSAPSIRRASSLLRPHQFGDPLLMPPNESLHFLKGNGAIVVGVHRFEDSLVCRLKLLQCEFPVAVSIHQTENYSHHRGCHAAAAPSIPVVMPVAVSHHCAAEHSVTHHP